MKPTELTSEGWPIIRAEYRNDDPAELSLMDDFWHRGAYWTYSVAGTGICEEGDAYYAARNSWVDARNRVTAKLKAMGYDVAVLVSTAPNKEPDRSLLTL